MGRQSGAKYHTTITQLADLAREAKPRLLLLYHQAGVAADGVFAEMSGRYSGLFAVPQDFDVY
jgi:ribonuclease BN (tRNA processing enzyme)